MKIHMIEIGIKVDSTQSPWIEWSVKKNEGNYATKSTVTTKDAM
jgi:hypothetical protein